MADAREGDAGDGDKAARPPTDTRGSSLTVSQ
jgi:hypothetical protein